MARVANGAGRHANVGFCLQQKKAYIYTYMRIAMYIYIIDI